MIAEGGGDLGCVAAGSDDAVAGVEGGLASSMPIPRAAPVMNQTAGVVGVVSVMGGVPFWSDVVQSRRPVTA